MNRKTKPGRVKVDKPHQWVMIQKRPLFQATEQTTSDEGTRQNSEAGGQQNPAGGPGVVDPPSEKEFIGTRSYTFVRTVFWRDLALRAITFEWDPTQNPSIRTTGSSWSIFVETKGSSNNLEEVLPVMVVAAVPYIAVHSEEPITGKLTSVNRRVKVIRDGV